LVHRPYWRRGLATEAALGVRSYAWDALGRDRLISLVRPINVASRGVARKLGMLPESETQFHGLPHLVFSVTKSSVQAAAGDLESLDAVNRS
jgi:RimJ/RimL family protein N-acetyltransferase